MVTNILIFFILIHKISKENREVDNEDKQGSHDHLKDFIFDINFFLEINVEIRNQQFTWIDLKLLLIF